MALPLKIFETSDIVLKDESQERESDKSQTLGRSLLWQDEAASRSSMVSWTASS